MIINQKVIAALAALEIPVVTLVYKGAKPDTYIAFHTLTDRRSSFASGEPIQNEVSFQVDLFCKSNFQTTCESVLGALRAAFVANRSVELYEDDTGYYHQVFYCYDYHNNMNDPEPQPDGDADDQH